MPVAILVAGYREFPGGEIETVNFDVRPALVEFGGSEFCSVIIEQQGSRNRFLRKPMPLRWRLPVRRLCSRTVRRHEQDSAD